MHVIFELKRDLESNLSLVSNYFRLTIKLQNDTFTFNQKQTKLKFDLETQSDVLEATLINLNSTSDTLLDLEKSINESNSQNKTKINLLENQYTESSKRLAESIQQNLDTNDLVKKLTLNLHCEQELNAKLVIQLASLEELKNEAEETIVQSQRKQTQELNMIKVMTTTLN